MPIDHTCRRVQDARGQINDLDEYHIVDPKDIIGGIPGNKQHANAVSQKSSGEHGKWVSNIRSGHGVAVHIQKLHRNKKIEQTQDDLHDTDDCQKNF